MNDIINLKKSPFWVWLIVMLGLVFFNQMGLLGEPLLSVGILLSASLLAYAPFIFSAPNETLVSYLSFNRNRIFYHFKILSLTTLITLVPYALIAFYIFRQDVDKPLNEVSGYEILAYLFNQFVLVGVPEEIFFRGYLEERFTQKWPASTRFFGAFFGKAQWITALVFAFSHSLISFQWWHFSIFFPALVFSWLKQKTGTIWASAFYHALCNTLAWLIFKMGT